MARMALWRTFLSWHILCSRVAFGSGDSLFSFSLWACLDRASSVAAATMAVRPTMAMTSIRVAIAGGSAAVLATTTAITTTPLIPIGAQLTCSSCGGLCLRTMATTTTMRAARDVVPTTAQPAVALDWEVAAALRTVARMV